MALLAAGLALFCLDGIIVLLEGGFLASLPSRSLWQRLWVVLPGVALAVVVAALTIAAAGPVGIPLGVATGVLALEVWVGLSWYHAWVGGLWLGASRRVLDSNPELDTKLSESRVWRFFTKRWR
jgi:energy-coupling factor transporter transmembrane protein EcfT